MAKIKQKISITDTEDSLIRREWDNNRNRLYFSITDVIGVLTESVDARNYWKALKSRLKTAHNQLVMDCNQLKLKSSDGKFYLVDTADADTILKIIQIIAPYNVPAFKSWFEHIDVQSSIELDKSSPQNNSPTILGANNDGPGEIHENELSTALTPLIDIYENKNEIILQIILPGASPDKIIITANMSTLTIKGERNQIRNIPEENYLMKELQWGEFYRSIELPSFVDVDNILATELQGLVTITLPKMDQTKNRFIKIKSV